MQCQVSNVRQWGISRRNQAYWNGRGNLCPLQTSKAKQQMNEISWLTYFWCVTIIMSDVRSVRSRVSVALIPYRSTHVFKFDSCGMIRYRTPGRRRDSVALIPYHSTHVFKFDSCGMSRYRPPGRRRECCLTAEGLALLPQIMSVIDSLSDSHF